MNPFNVLINMVWHYVNRFGWYRVSLAFGDRIKSKASQKKGNEIH